MKELAITMVLELDKELQKESIYDLDVSKRIAVKLIKTYIKEVRPRNQLLSNLIGLIEEINNLN